MYSPVFVLFVQCVALFVPCIAALDVFLFYFFFEVTKGSEATLRQQLQNGFILEL
jgi:hypothetical protein